MMEIKELLCLLDRIAAGTCTEDDLDVLRRMLSAHGQENTVQLGKYNVDIGRGQDIQIGDRVYHGPDAAAIQQAIRAVLDEYRLVPLHHPKVYHILALISRKRGQFSRAAELCDNAYRLALEMGSEDLQALVQNERGKLARDMQDWDAAWQHFTAVQEWFENRTATTPRDDDLAFGNMGQMAWVAYHLGRLEEARSLFLQSLDLFAARSKGYKTTLRYRLALVEEALGHLEPALAHASDAVYWFERVGMQRDLEEAQSLLARLQTAKRSQE